jgi:hypothetical protein
MKLLIIAIILLSSLTCLSQSKKTDVFLKQGGEIAKDYTQGKLISVKRSMWGFKSTFLTDSSGIISVFLREKLKTGICYYVPNYLIKK